MFALVFGLANSISAHVSERTIADISIMGSGVQEDWILSIDLGDLTNKSEAGISKEISDFLDAGLTRIDADLQCKVHVTGKVTVGLATVEIKVEVSGSCAEMKKQGAQIANEVLAEIKKALKR